MALNRHQEEDDRDDKLRAYDGKDYAEIIEFPVELVDRDGVVRRYSYEESLAVYHRRIQSAPWRYGDDDLIRAEIGHCTRRIDQIKRSYSANRDNPPAAPNPRASLGEGFEVLRRFYDKVLARRRLRPNGELAMSVTLLQDEPACRVYHVAFGAARGGHLLYVYPFDRRGDGDPQEAWREAQAGFRGQASGTGVERMLLAESGSDAGYVLTGTEEIPEGLRQQTRTHETRDDAGALDADDESQPWWLQYAADEEDPPLADAAFETGVLALREDRAGDAIDAFRLVVDQNPYHREAYLALLAVLDGAGRYEEADLYGEMAGRHLPGDGLVRYRQAINLVRQGKLDKAMAAFDEAAQLAPSLYQPPYFAAHVLIARGKDLDGALRRLRAAVAADDSEPHVRESLRCIERCVALRRSVRLSAVGVCLLSVAAVTLGQPLAAIGVGVAALCGLCAAPLARTVARWSLQRDGLSAPRSAQL